MMTRRVRRLRVAMLGPYPENPQRIAGGVDAVVATLAGEMAAHRPEIDLHILRCVADRRRPTIEQGNGLTLHWLPRRRWGRLTFHARDVAELRRALAALRPDLVHAHGTGLYAGAAVSVPWPAVITVHGIVFREARLATGLKDRLGWELDALYERWVLRQARHLIAISPYVVREFSRWTRAKVHLIENPVADAFFDLSSPGEPGRILFAGRLIPRKDPLTAIRAFAIFQARCPGAQLRIAGALDDSTCAAAAKALSAELGLAEKVHFLGHLSEAELLAEYRACWALLLSSVQETAPIVIEQALAAGRPVVTTAAGGAGSLVEDGVTGFVVPIGDAAGLAKGLNRLFDNPDLYQQMATAARQQATLRFKVSAVVAQTVELYYQLVYEH